METTNIQKQKKGLKRNIIDKFYTKTSTVDICYKNIKSCIKIDKNDLVIEPSAGNGSFINIIKKLTKNYIFYDLEPENKEILKQDYLITKEEWYRKDFSRIHIVGNPPFGRQSSLAIKFIKKSSELGDTISFILPKSFKKDSLKKHFPINFHLISQITLPKNSFVVNKEEHDVPCIFQIWEKRDFNREVPKKVLEEGFRFVKKDENPDISFRRVGVYAGKIDIDIDKSQQSHYFIKFNNGSDLEETIHKIENMNFEVDNTVGPRSISKQELIKELNRALI